MTSRSISILAVILILALSSIGCQPTYTPTTYTPTVAYESTIQPVVVPAPTDPCASIYFNETACSMALMSGGYWHYGQFMAYPVGFNRSVFYYRNDHHTWLRKTGNRPIIINYNQPEYSRTYQRPANVTTRNSQTTRDTSTGSYQAPATISTPVVSGSGSQRSNTITPPRAVQTSPAMVNVPVQRGTTVSPVQATPPRYSSFQAPAARPSSTVTRSSQSSGLTNNTSLSSGRSSSPTRTTVSSSPSRSTTSSSSSSRSSSGPTRR